MPTQSTARAALVGAALSIAAALAAPALAQQGGGGPPATPVGVAEVGERVTRQTVPVIGRLVARRAGDVAAKASGAVEAFLVDVGDRVEERALLARLDTESAALQVDLASSEVQQRQAALEESRSRLALAQQELQRLASLRRSAAFSQARYDDKSEEVTGASHAVSEAQALLTIAESRLALAELTLRDASIRAPYPGVVTERYTEVGAYVSTGAPVVSLLNDRDLEVAADVPFDLIAGLTVGDVIEVRLDDAVRAEATVRAIIPAEDSRTRTRPARFRLPAGVGEATGLAAGQTVTLFIPEGPDRTVLAVPKDAVISNPAGSTVFVVVDGVAQPRPVTLGQAVGDSFTVLDGLSAGDTVVTRGNERLRPGQPVRPTVPPSAGGGSGGPDSGPENGPETGPEG
ncbi:efflux RND transporter periplasmic adaptor subunit [Roseospira navarrensis]|uniref:Efflux RND transporter periplasmic adaptor subunit n=1 Tax=Roseospira navarrensis TaxID=140058 RepID=A0A7X2D670_9PROT|nr:efflux RND transporter periplasmic adaptor subunit [Roseospira navarrensis]MQX38407.1 efflux RND transporter periplasmic adaptor subunit [Roseospira navarrensis]